jgi:uncharacterized protein (DUF433 family)
MPVALIFENLEAGMTVDEVAQTYDGVSGDQIRAVLDFAARSLETSLSQR